MWTSSETTAGRRTDGPAAGAVPRRFLRASFRRFLIVLAILPAFLAVAILLAPADAASRTRPSKGVYHLVKKGETLSGIAQAYGVTVDTIRQANNMSAKDRLETDRALFIPGAKTAIDDTRPKASRKSAKPPPPSAERASSGRERKGSGKAREKETAGAKEPARPKQKEAKAKKDRPAPDFPAAEPKTRKPAALKPKAAGTADPASAPAPLKAAAKAPARTEKPAAPAGRITVAEGQVFLSEADREKAEKEAAESRNRAAEAAKEPAPKPGERPDGTRSAAVKPGGEPEHAKDVAPAAKGKPPAAGTTSGDEKPEKEKRKKLQWPVKGRVLTRFGPQQNGMYSNGVRIAAREGTPVVAAEHGTVIFSAPLKDYGETIILRHEDSYATVYTNLGSRLVNADDKVRAGARIGSVGRDERAATGVLHFEVRVKNKACNPLLFLN
ncbi:MAG: peptidoglycan DD-metalloendopeptidase family protein [Syntrophaceae bacterium]|nr:peptidoglycan DD-metalloendopeptidase family protein [Syntrophaceae bacterium]